MQLEKQDISSLQEAKWQSVVCTYFTTLLKSSRGCHFPSTRDFATTLPMKLYLNRTSKNTKKPLEKVQKQSPEVLCKKKCSYKFRRIHRKTPVPQSLLNKVAGLMYFLLNSAKFLGASFLTEHLRCLLLKVAISLL